MKTFDISYEEFERHLKSIQNFEELQEGLSGCFTKYRKKNDDGSDLLLPSLVKSVIDLLSILVNDESEWIYYWVYELNFGKRYKDGMVTDKNGTNIKLKTINDLWNLIVSDQRLEKNNKTIDQL